MVLHLVWNFCFFSFYQVFQTFDPRNQECLQLLNRQARFSHILTPTQNLRLKFMVHMMICWSVRIELNFLDCLTSYFLTKLHEYSMRRF